MKRCWLSVAMGSVLASLLAACGTPHAAEAPTGSVATGRPAAVPQKQVLQIQISQTQVDTRNDGVHLKNLGTADVRFTEPTINHGQLDYARGSDGGAAVRFPRYQPSAEAPAAMIGVWAKGKKDVLSPRRNPFSFGADFRLDRKSWGRPSDNGDNLIQRGFYAEPAQYKIQLDKRYPSCRIQGSAGAVFAKSKTPVAPGTWYRVTCRRQGSTIQLTVGRLDHGHFADKVTYAATGKIGVILMKDPHEPLSIGGKIDHDGSVTRSSTDQFNGVARRIFFDVE